MRFLSVLWCLIAAAVAFGQPELHYGYQNVPHDGTGRLGGNAVDDFAITHHNTVFWPTHTFAELFYTRTHDRYWREIGGRWVPRAELLREYAAFIDAHAEQCLDQVEEALDGRRPAKRIWVFVDLEFSTIQRRPYVEPDAQGYGPLDVKAMNLLCDRIQYLGGRRWGDRGSDEDGPVEVVAAPYHPLRSFGHWAGLQDPAPEFITKWHGDAVWPLIDRKAVWVHNYTPEDPAGFLRQPQNHRTYTRGNVGGQFKSILESGALPEDVFVTGWFYTQPSVVEAEGVMRGVADVLAQREWPWRTHLVWCGDWGNLTYLVDQPVERQQRSPLVLSIDAAMAGKALAHAWVQAVETACFAVFGDSVQ